ncbi:MAG TPA: hypothetical protein VHB27_14315 [Rhodopila sp.]|uniref:hypothetical protein n=1 Tax=Rhodopila sp. TaxID=2480087 RepID=UPI002CC0ACFC|nr:hypothetical protein [Rhodopila sp.]HVY16396.1 hypothetical protein [Rhodopila sp.]
MTKISADTVEDFMDKANAKFGGSNLGETDAKPSFKYGSFKDGKVLKLEISCPIDLDYAEMGSGKPDDEGKKAIAAVADIAKAHELSHKAGYEKAFKDFDAKKTAKDIMDKTFKNKGEADKAIHQAFSELKKALLDACLALHKKEGIVEVTKQANGSYKIVQKPAGATGCS